MSKQNGTWTKNFDMFSLDKENRPHEPGKHKALYESLEKNGYDGARPIVCVRRSGRLFIVDGQHRYHWCREHEAAFTYTVSEFAAPREFNAVEIPWSMDNWIASHVAGGNKAVQELDAFRKEYGLSPTTCEMLLAGRCGTVHGAYVKQGNVQIKDRDFAHKVASTVSGLTPSFKYAKDMLCVTAIARFCRVPEFDSSKLVAQANKRPGLLIRQATVDQYSSMFTEVYNYGAKNSRIPLNFMADEVMRARNRALNRKGHP